MGILAALRIQGHQLPQTKELWSYQSPSLWQLVIKGLWLVLFLLGLFRHLQDLYIRVLLWFLACRALTGSTS